MQAFRVEGNTIISGPVSPPRTWAADDGTQYPIRELWQKGHTAEVVALGWLPQSIVSVPFDASTHYVSGYTHTINGSQVDSTPIVSPLPPEEAQAIADDANDFAQETTIKANPQVKALITATSAQIDNYIDTNVTDLASAKSVLKILAKAVSAIGRRQFR